MTATTIYDGLPTLAALAFEGLIPEPAPSITEADLDDPAAKQADLDDLEEMESTEHGDFDPDYERESPSRFGMDFGDEDAIFGKGI